ncbi:MAG: 23S rRNA (pseudouridine(1915)-N(3))-methyltransferase RlmH [Nitrospirae bacterium]|nr:MAG: 23S rRNA (pseudouridine(1915)-N(3))-methyltransferase RlmH [Nitrospirota bacterium]
MIKIRLLWVGKNKESYLNDGIAHYLKLLKPMAHVSIVEIKEEKNKTGRAALALEAKRIFDKTQSYILLDEKGKEHTSVGLAGFIKDKAALDFVIGGPFGVDEEVKTKASLTLALSKMTLTHEMSRLILLEQLYRAMSITKGRGYHH